MATTPLGHAIPTGTDQYDPLGTFLDIGTYSETLARPQQASSKAALPAPRWVGDVAWVSGSSTASENGRYVSLDGTSWMKDGAIAQFSLGSAQTIAASNSTPFALTSGAINELGATISGTNVSVPDGRYLVTLFVQLSVSTAGTWINMTLNGSNVQLVGGQNVETNSPTGYTSLRGTFHVIAGSGAALSATLSSNNSLSQRIAGYLTIQRIG